MPYTPYPKLPCDARCRSLSVGAAIAMLITAMACSPPGPSGEPKNSGDAASSQVEEAADSAGKAAAYRELLFGSYIQKKAGMLDEKGVLGFRIESPDAVDERFWKNLLGYGGSSAEVTVLSRTHKIHDHFADSPRVESFPGIDEKQAGLHQRWRIVEPTYGAAPLRSFSGLARVSYGDTEYVVVRFELAYVWIDNRWSELVRTVQELPTTQEPKALNADSSGSAAP